jgi:hypothetical protein
MAIYNFNNPMGLLGVNNNPTGSLGLNISPTLDARAKQAEEDEAKRKRAEQSLKLQNLADTLRMVNANKSGNTQGVALYSNRLANRRAEEQARLKAEQAKRDEEKLINSMNPEQQRIYKTFGPNAAFQYQQNLQSGEIAAMAEQRQIQSLINAGYTPEQANAIVVGGLKADEVKNLNVSSGQSIIDETNEIVETLNKDTGMQNDYSNLNQAFGPVDALQENILNKPGRFLLGKDFASDTAAAIRDKDNLNLEILATLANDYTGRPSNLLLGEIKKNIPEGSATSEADAFQKYSNFKIQTQSRIANLEQGIRSENVSDATKEKYREELVKSKTLLKKLEAATASLAPKDSVSVKADTNFVSEGKYNNYFINKGNDF